MKILHKVVFFWIFFLIFTNNEIFAEDEKILNLDINQVTELALENNFDIQIYRLDKSISEKDLLKSQSVYDTILGASYKYDEDRLERSSVIMGRRSTEISQAGSLKKKLPTGTILSLDFDHVRQATDSTFSSLNPHHETSAGISILQPLAKNALGIIDRNTIKITGLDVQSSGYTSLNKIELELAQTQRSYWALVLARRHLMLANDMLENTRTLYEANKRNFDMGMVELPEFYAVQADLHQETNAVLIAENSLHNALNLIRYKLNLSDDAIIIPVDDFSAAQITSSFTDVMSTALTNRRDYRIAKNDVKAMRMDVEMKKNALWPQIDLRASLMKNGLDQKFSSSIREITSKDQPRYTIEVVFSFPLEDRHARAEYSQAELEAVKALVNLKKTECLIFVEANDAFIDAKRIYDSVRLSRLSADLEHKKYLGEEDRFNKGRSDTDRLLRYQHDYINAELLYLKSLYEYENSIIVLNVAMNNLLKTGEEGGI